MHFFVHTNRFMSEFYETIAKRIDKRIDDGEVRVGPELGFGEKKNF